MFFKVNIRPVKIAKAPSLKAFADVVLNDMFLIKGIKVLRNTQNDKLFISMPQEQVKKYNPKTKMTETVWEDRFMPLTAEARNTLSDAVITQYQKHMLQNVQATNQVDIQKTNDGIECLEI